MASPRINLIVGFLLLNAGRALASGGSYDEAPPTLDYYLQRLPAKSIGQIMNESGNTPKIGAKAVIDQAQLLRDFAAGPSPQLVEKMNRLIDQARLNYSGPTEINLLQDLRDLAGSNGTATEVSDYVKWRLDHLGWFSAFSGYPWEKPKTDTNRPSELDAKIQDASQAMLPHWLYLKGAYYYKDGNDTDSETHFDRVLNEFPNGPRAESALFMKARCRLSQSVETYEAMRTAAKDFKAIREQARQLFQDYLTKYPHGRYCNDVVGWLGGAEYRSGDYAQALPYFIQQTEVKDHPEDFQPAVVMIEKCLYHLRGSSSADIDQVAQHPSVALALAYFALNSAIPKEYGNDQEVANIQTWRHAVLPKLATAVLAHKELYQGQIGQNRYLAILAHAASDQGNQDQAMELVHLADKSQENDDLAFVRALVLQRAGKLDEAVGAYRHFITHFPNSSLAPGVRYRLALALHDQNKDGDALLELAALRDNHLPLRTMTPAAPLPNAQPTHAATSSPSSMNPVSAIGVDYSGASDQQIDQTMDALLNFAPLKSLETALKGNDKEHEEFRSDLRQVFQERSLAHEDFAGAANFTDSPDLKKTFHALAEQARDLQSTSGVEAAKESFQMADYWASHSKMLVAFPLDGTDARRYLFGDDGLVAGLRRRTNGIALSFLQPDQELENRNELQHAIKWWLKTAEIDHANELAPQALWKVIQAQRKIVEVSPYTQKRAVETNFASEARKIYDALEIQYPDSAEAKKYAVYWNFPTQDELTKAGQYYAFPGLLYSGNNYYQVYDNWTKALGFSRADYRYEKQSEWKAVLQNLAKLPETTKSLDGNGFALEIASQLDLVKPLAMSMERMPVVNCLEDLQQVSQVTNLDPGIRNEYLNLRLRVLRTSVCADIDSFSSYGSRDGQDFNDDKLRSDIADFEKKPGTDSIRDFIDFLNLAVTANHLIEVPATGLEKDGQAIAYDARDFPLLAAQADSFLKQYPKSPKREAAMILRLRGLVLAARPHPFEHTLDWPAANSWGGDNAPLFFKQAALDTSGFENTLQSYNAEFPHGLYPNAVLSLRTDVALINNQWGEALDDLVALHDQKTAPEFQEQIVTELSSLFDKLDHDDQRYPILQEVLKRPAARVLLQAYLVAGGLPYLKDYLLDRLAKP